VKLYSNLHPFHSQSLSDSSRARDSENSSQIIQNDRRKLFTLNLRMLNSWAPNSNRAGRENWNHFIDSLKHNRWGRKPSIDWRIPSKSKWPFSIGSERNTLNSV
jgi:hypothetical protein